MKISNSKKALAKVINENGGWIDDSANWAVQPKHEGGDVWFSSSDNKPRRNEGLDGFTFDGRVLWLDDAVKHDKLLPNWHQTILSKEEYFHLYPVAGDGWIEWGGGDCPVDVDVLVCCKWRSGKLSITAYRAGSLSWRHNGNAADIIAYRLHKPEVKPEFCESVTRSIPEPAEKPTIEQLSADYRNKLDYANRKQQEADDAKAAADAALGDLERAGDELGLVIVIAKTEPELTITDWRDLQVGDLVKVVSSMSGNRSGEVGAVTRFDKGDKGREVRVHFNNDPSDYEWCEEWEFVRRP